MYVFGGYEEIIERFGQDVYRLDLSSYAWKLLVSKNPLVRLSDCTHVHHGHCYSPLLESRRCTGTSTQPRLLAR